MQLLFATGYSCKMLVNCSEVLLTLLLGFLALPLEEFFLLGRTNKSLIEIMIAIEEIIVLTAAFLSGFKSSTSDAQIHILNKRRVSIRLLLKLPLWRVLVVLLLEAVGEVFLMTIFASRLYPLEASGARFRGVLV